MFAMFLGFSGWSSSDGSEFDMLSSDVNCSSFFWMRWLMIDVSCCLGDRVLWSMMFLTRLVMS